MRKHIAVDCGVWQASGTSAPYAFGFFFQECTQLRPPSRCSDAQLKVIDPQNPKSIWYFTNASWLGFRIVRLLRTPSVEEMHKACNMGPGPTLE